MPRISIVIPTLNEEELLPRCLNSIVAQDLDLGMQVDVSIADAGSTDATREIARKYDVRILDNSVLRDPESAKMLGFRHVTGDYCYFMDADEEFASPQTLVNMIRVLESEPTLAGATGRYTLRASDPPANRCLSMDSLQRDPFYAAITPGLPDASGILQISTATCPPFGGPTAVYRMSMLSELDLRGERLMDVDLPLKLANAGHGRFAYVHDATFYHLTCASLSEMFRKRMRNLDNGRNNGLLTAAPGTRLYKWLDIGRFGFAMTTLRVLAAASGAWGLASGTKNFLKYRDASAFLGVIMGPMAFFAVAYGLLKSGAGRRLLWETFSH